MLEAKSRAQQRPMRQCTKKKWYMQIWAHSSLHIYTISMIHTGNPNVIIMVQLCLKVLQELKQTKNVAHKIDISVKKMSGYCCITFNSMLVICGIFRATGRNSIWLPSSMIKMQILTIWFIHFGFFMELNLISHLTWPPHDIRTDCPTDSTISN